MIRAQTVQRDGQRLTCLLLSGNVPTKPMPRQWVETEFALIRKPRCYIPGPSRREFTLTTIIRMRSSITGVRSRGKSAWLKEMSRCCRFTLTA